MEFRFRVGFERTRLHSVSGSRVHEFEYDKDEEIVFARCSEPIRLDTPKDIDAFFDESLAFWQREVKKRVYYVVDITNLSINMQFVDVYARNIMRMLTICAVTIVRHGGDPLQRTAGRIAAMRLHVPSRIYETREDAIAVVHGLRDGSIEIQRDPE